MLIVLLNVLAIKSLLKNMLLFVSLIPTREYNMQHYKKKRKHNKVHQYSFRTKITAQSQIRLERIKRKKIKINKIQNCGEW